MNRNMYLIYLAAIFTVAHSQNRIGAAISDERRDSQKNADHQGRQGNKASRDERRDTLKGDIIAARLAGLSIDPRYDYEGFDQYGYNRAGYGRRGYDARGFDRDGYSRLGFHSDNYVAEFEDAGGGWTKDGFDISGFDRDGYGRAGYHKNGFDRAGYDRQGYSSAGLNRNGYCGDSRCKNSFRTAYSLG